MPNQLPAKRPSTQLPSTQLPSTLATIMEQAKGYSDAAKADNTRRAYEADWRHFESWCKTHGLSALPALPGTVAAYLAGHASELKVSTLGRRLAAIRAVHLYAGKPIDLAAPALRDVWAGIRRTHGGQQTKKRALLTADLRRAVAILPDSVIGIRDRALLLIGFASAMRRSELATIVVGKKSGHRVRFTDNGLVIEVGRSKSDQEANGTVIGIPFGSHAETCPVRALRAWLDVAGITSGPVFRSVTRHAHISKSAMTGHGIALVVKRAVFRAALADGHDKKAAYALADSVGGHSLRAGFVTSADAAGAPIAKVMEQARHVRFETTRGYIREADAFRDNAASYLGL